MEIAFGKKLCKERIAYDNLAELQDIIFNASSDMNLLNITTEGRFGKTFLFLIRCLPLLSDQFGKSINITVSNVLYENLCKTRFLADTRIKLGHVGVLCFEQLHDVKTTLDLTKRIVNDIPVDMSERLREDMISKIGELFINAHEHSNAKHVLGGRYTKSQGKYCFACYDTGIGISEKIRTFLTYNKNEFSDEEALKWALERLNTTVVTSNKPRGLGLDLLRRFCRANAGVIRICSGNTLYTYDCRGVEPVDKYQLLKNLFRGTLFEMDINTDDRKYI